MGHNKTWVGLAAAAAIAAPSVAGTTITPDLQFMVGAEAGTFVIDATAAGNSWANGNGTFGFTGSTEPAYDAPHGFRLGWNMLVSSDPFIVGSIVVTNTSQITQSILVRMSVPVDSPMAFTLVGGSIAGSVTDLNGNGASLSSIGSSPIYTGVTDFGFASQSTAGSLLSSTTVTAGPNLSADIGPARFGGIIPLQPHGPVRENITVEFRFTLSAGDAATLTSIFEVAAVPAPGVLAVLGLAGAVRGRRRR